MANVNPQENPPNGETDADVAKKLVDAVPVKDLPAFLFLFTNPNQVRLEKGGAEDMKYDDAKLEAVFKKTLKDGLTQNMQKDLEQLFMNILENCEETNRKVKFRSLSELIDGKMIEEKEEQIVRMHDILQMFNIDVPEKFKKSFKEIIFNYSIPVGMTEDENRYFVCSENIAYRKLSDQLECEDVAKIYECSKEDVEEIKGNMQKMQHINKEALQKEGMKDVAFYYLVMLLRRKSVLNRLHTHTLQNVLKKRKKTHDNTDSSVKVDPYDQLNRYHLSASPPGLCIIFNVGEETNENRATTNNIYRPGSEKDRRKMKTLFAETFNYNVLDYVNPDKDKVNFIINRIRDDQYKFYDSLVVVFMAHGNMQRLQVMDGEIDLYGDLIDPIARIKWLQKKPKLFFMQACRGKVTPHRGEDAFQSGCDAQPINSTVPMSRPYTCPEMEEMYGGKLNFDNLNPKADILVAYATTWHEYAIRNPEHGSPYINTLYENLKMYGHQESLTNILSRVNYTVNALEHNSPTTRGKVFRQAPYFSSALQKVFVFPPHPKMVK